MMGTSACKTRQKVLVMVDLQRIARFNPPLVPPEGLSHAVNA
jgi:hypothetical protein